MKKVIRPQGLGFLEVIIALSVMIIGVTSGLTLTTYNLATVVVAENRVLATGLAREPIEVLRAWRDSNWLESWSWNNDVNVGSDYVVFPIFDQTNNEWLLYWSNESNLDSCDRCKVVYDSVKKMYIQGIDTSGQPLTAATSTGYRRWTKVQNICWNQTSQRQELKDFGQSCSDRPIGWRLTTDVSWYDNQNKKTLSINEEIYDWR